MSEDEFTADYIRSLGFTDVEVVGCPSMFMFGPDLPQTRVPAEINAESRIVVAASRKPLTAAMGPIIDRHHSRYPRLMYMAQDHADLDLLLWGERHRGVEASSLPNTMDHPMYLENKMRFFCDPWPWIDFMRDYDVSFGTRIHGAITSLLAGTPTYVLAHDSRTLELARYFQIPNQLLSATPSDVDVSDLLENADFGPMRAGHAARFDVLADFLARNGLQHSYAEGGDPAAFEARVAGSTFPEGVETLTSLDELAQRLRSLRNARNRSVQRADALEQQLAAMSQSMEKLERAQRRHKQRISSLEKESARPGLVKRIGRKLRPR